MYSRHAIGSPLHVGLVPSNYPRLCPAYAISRGYAISHSQCWAPLLKKTATVVATFLVRFASAYPNGFPPPGLWRQMGSGGCPPGTLPCLQGIVCYTRRPQRHGNGAYDVTKRPLPPAGKRLRGLAGIQSQGRALTRWYTTYLGRYCQSSHSLLWASHHTGNAGSFGERVGKSVELIKLVSPCFLLKGKIQLISLRAPK